MSYIVNGVEVKQIGVLTEPNSYQTTITPADIQMGMTAISKGKVITGTGKVFEFASYGSRVIDVIVDNNGVERYGTTFNHNNTINVIFVAPSPVGDIFIQDEYIVSISKGDDVIIAYDQTIECELRAYHDGERLIVYLTKSPNEPTVLRIFVGKDNYI